MLYNIKIAIICVFKSIECTTFAPDFGMRSRFFRLHNSTIKGLPGSAIVSHSVNQTPYT